MAEEGRDECFAHRIKGVSFALHGPAVRSNFHQTKNDYLLESFGTTSEKDLAAKGIERV